MKAAIFSPGGDQVPTLIRPIGNPLINFRPFGTIWDPGSGHRIADLQEQAGTSGVFRVGFADVSAPERVRYSTDGSHILGWAHENKTLWIWRASSGTLVASLPGQADLPSSQGFSADGGRFVTASEESGQWLAHVWNTRTGEKLATHKGHQDAIHRASFSRDGSVIATASSDRTGRVWESSSGKLHTVLEGNSFALTDISFSPDGRRIVTTSEQGETTIWDRATGQRLHDLPNESGHAYRAQASRYSPDGKRLLTSAYGRIEIREVGGSFERVPDWWAKFLWVLSGFQFTDDGELRRLPSEDRQRLRRVVRAAVANDRTRLAELAAWFLAPLDERPIAPGDPRTAREVADSLIEVGAPLSNLLRAYQLQSNHPLIHLAISRYQGKDLIRWGDSQLADFDARWSVEERARSAFFEDYSSRRLPSDPALRSRANALLEWDPLAKE